MLILGIILLIIGIVTHIHLIWIIGLIVGAVGLLLLFFGYSNHPVGGRRYWY